MKQHLLFRIVLAISMGLICMQAGAQDSVRTRRLISEWTGTQFFGAENAMGIHSLVMAGENKILPARLWEENNTAKKLLGTGYRTAKLALIDWTSAYMLMLVQHEMYGHGSRIRETGIKKMQYSLHLPPPFGDGAGFVEYNSLPGYLLSEDERLAITFGGVEGTSLFARELDYKLFQQNSISHQEAMLNICNRVNLPGYAWLDWYMDQKGLNGGGDILGYVNRMNVKYGTPEKRYTPERVMKHSLISALNPFPWYSAFSIVWPYAIKGRDGMNQLPALHFGEMRYLPALSYNFTPFGGEFCIHQYAAIDNRTFHLQVNIGDGYFEKFWGAGITATRLISRKTWDLGVLAGGWVQPPLTFGGEALSQSGSGPGGYLKADFTYAPSWVKTSARIFLQAGYKTNGYLMGEFLRRGIIFRGGIQFNPFGR